MENSMKLLLAATVASMALAGFAEAADMDLPAPPPRHRQAPPPRAELAPPQVYRAPPEQYQAAPCDPCQQQQQFGYGGPYGDPRDPRAYGYGQPYGYGQQFGYGQGYAQGYGYGGQYGVQMVPVQPPVQVIQQGYGAGYGLYPWRRSLGLGLGVFSGFGGFGGHHHGHH